MLGKGAGGQAKRVPAPARPRVTIIVFSLHHVVQINIFGHRHLRNMRELHRSVGPAVAPLSRGCRRPDGPDAHL